MTSDSHDRERPRRTLRLALAGGLVGAAHLALLVGIGLMKVEGDIVMPSSPMIIDLLPMVPPVPLPVPDKPPTPRRGGGAPPAPSIVHTPPVATDVPPEVSAPLTPAPEQPLVVGRSSSGEVSSSQGQGGIGTGTGGGIGDGEGDGRGQGPRLVRGPSTAELRALHPREAFRRRQGGSARLSCQIRLDRLLEGCTVVSETPAGMGFGVAALSATRYFRFEPPVRNGQRVAGATVQVGVEWP